MPRPKEFDRDAVLDRAMRLFWRKGYEATSVQDLVEATGINRGSMYATYGDKRRLFAAALDRYIACNTVVRLEALEANSSPKAALRGFFDDLVAFSLGKGRKLGCLMTNSAVEVAPLDGELRDRLRDGFARVEDALYRTLLRAQRAGEIAPGRDVRALARFLLGVLQGLRVLARSAPEEGLLRDIVNEALHALD